MDFFVKNKVLINFTLIISEVLDVVIAIVVNIITREDFNIFAMHNIIMCGILVFLIIVHSVCKYNYSPKVQNKRFMKAFLDHGGYDLVAEEAKECIKKRDYRSLKDLKKMIDLVER